MSTASSKPSLKELSYYKTGGSSKYLILPKSEEELQTAIIQLNQNKIEFYVLGAGSNSLVLDDYYDGAVICLVYMKDIKRDGESLICGAGCENSEIVEFAYDNSLNGLAWMYGLPGHIGGTTRMNARCYGGEISEVCTKVKAVTIKGELITYDEPKAVFRGYKDTLLMDSGDIIYEVTLGLKKGQKEDIIKVMNHCKNDRIQKGQYDFPSCGCVFKNNYSVGISSGMLLDKAGVKNLSSENLRINPQHANFLFNTNNASSREIIEMTLKMRDLVYSEFGVFLDYEMEILGNAPLDLKEKITTIKPQKWNTSKLDALRKVFNSSMAK